MTMSVMMLQKKPPPFVGPPCFLKCSDKWFVDTSSTIQHQFFGQPDIIQCTWSDKIRKFSNVIICANQKIFFYYWLLAHASFDVTRFPAFVGALAIIFSHLLIRQTVHRHRGSDNSQRPVCRRGEGRSRAADPGWRPFPDTAAPPAVAGASPPGKTTPVREWQQHRGYRNNNTGDTAREGTEQQQG